MTQSYVNLMTQELHEIALDDARLAKENGIDLNPFSTQGGRNLWQKGWDDVRPANLVDGSIDWRFWERGRQARAIAQETDTAQERPRAQ